MPRATRVCGGCWPPPDTVALVVLEATGHYGFNVVATVVADGYPVAVLTPRRTAAFASGEELQRTKTDAVGLAPASPPRSARGDPPARRGHEGRPRRLYAQAPHGRLRRREASSALRAAGG